MKNKFFKNQIESKKNKKNFSKNFFMQTKKNGRTTKNCPKSLSTKHSTSQTSSPKSWSTNFPCPKKTNQEDVEIFEPPNPSSSPICSSTILCYDVKNYKLNTIFIFHMKIDLHHSVLFFYKNE